MAELKLDAGGLKAAKLACAAYGLHFDEGDGGSRMIEAAIRAYLTKAAPVGWRPIETAPKDVSILVHYNNGSIELIEEDDNDFDWKPYNGKDETSKGVSSPTHWQPLPAAPVTPGSEG